MCAGGYKYITQVHAAFMSSHIYPKYNRSQLSGIDGSVVTTYVTRMLPDYRTDIILPVIA